MKDLLSIILWDDYGKKEKIMDTLKKDNHKSWQHVSLMFLGILILVAGIGGAVLLVKTKPKAKKKKRASMIPVVESVMLKETDEIVIVNAMGTVIPARDINLQSEVNGRVVWIHPDFIEGGLIKQGDVLIKVENSDYKLSLLRKEAQLKIEKSNLRLEEGRQDIAKREWDMLNTGSDIGDADLELALRKPQYIKQKALVDAASSEMEQAELMLSRTEIKAPFDSVIRKALVNVGDQASLGKILAQLVATDIYWVLVSVRVDELRWVALPNAAGKKGASVKVILSGSRVREGVVIRQLPDLESNGRMARLLIAVDNPLGKKGDAKQAPMLLGEYVRVQIKGPSRTGVYRISREALRDGRELWLLDKDNKLNIVGAEVIWADKESVVLNGGTWKENDKLIITDLDVVVDGMQLRGVQDKQSKIAGEDHKMQTKGLKSGAKGNNLK